MLAAATAAATGTAGCPLEIQIQELEPMEYMKFQLRNSTIHLANTLRRILLAEIPTVAIDMVHIEKNTSVLPDEMLAHRLGLVPLLSSVANQMEYPWTCPCDGGCDHCSIEITLNVRCPPEQNRKLVTARDLVCRHSSVRPVEYASSVPAGLEKDDFSSVVIAKLTRGQEIRCRCIARKGIAKEHSKWMPTCTVIMAYVPHIEVNLDLMDQMDPGQKQEWVDYCPKKVFSHDSKSGVINVARPFDCIYCNECIVKAEDMGFDHLASVKYKRSKNGTYTFNFTIETSGVLPAEEILGTGLSVLRAKMQALKAELAKVELEQAYASASASAVVGGTSGAAGSRPHRAIEGSPTGAERTLSSLQWLSPPPHSVVRRILYTDQAVPSTSSSHVFLRSLARKRSGK